MNDSLLFDEPTWASLDGFLKNLPEPVKLVVWGDLDGGLYEQEAFSLLRRLARRYKQVLRYERRERVSGYAFYPVIGVMGEEPGGEESDYRVRFIGVPAGYQINSLVGAIQAVSFRAQNLEPRTRILLSRLPTEETIDLEIFTSADNEAGVLVATLAAGLAVASPQVRTFIGMTDIFPQVAVRYSVRHLPHTVINGRIHVEGVVNEEEMLRQMAKAVKRKG